MHKTWERRGDEPFERCSYCGGIRPSDVIRLRQEGWTVEPTDKSYKFYLNPPRGTYNPRQHPRFTPHGAFKLYSNDFTDEEWLSLWSGPR